MTPEVTRDVCLLARMMAANLYYSQIEDLMFEVFTPSAISKFWGSFNRQRLLLDQLASTN